MSYIPCFTEVCRAIRADADEMGLHLSGRKIKHIAGQYMQHRSETADEIAEECEADNWKQGGQLSYNSLTHSDPTGTTAIRNWFEDLVRQSQDPYPI